MRKITASDLREARLHTRDIIETAEAHFKTFPNDPNAEVLLSKEDIEKLLILVETAEEYAEQKAMARLVRRFNRNKGGQVE